MRSGEPRTLMKSCRCESWGLPSFAREPRHKTKAPIGRYDACCLVLLIESSVTVTGASMPQQCPPRHPQPPSLRRSGRPSRGTRAARAPCRQPTAAQPDRHSHPHRRTTRDLHLFQHLHPRACSLAEAACCPLQQQTLLPMRALLLLQGYSAVRPPSGRAVRPRSPLAGAGHSRPASISSGAP